MKRPLLLTGAIFLLAGILSALIYFIRCQLEKDHLKLEQEEPKMIRAAQVAGSFYPADPTQLRTEVDQLLKVNEKMTNEQMVKLLIVPHAGYIYSGPVAAAGFKQIEGNEYRRVVLIGASHQSWFEGAAIDNHDAWQTPLGQVLLDRNWAEKLIDTENKIVFSADPHLPEHSLEVELPFLQRVLTDFKIVPILLGITNDQILTALAEKIVQNLDEETLIVISTDLSHYPNYEIAQQVDQKTIEAILSGDPNKFEQTLAQEMAVGYPNLETCACGEKAVKVGLLVAQKLGSGNWQLIKYLNSGDTAGDKSRVVGYAAITFSTQKQAVKNQKGNLSRDQKQLLLKIARETLANYLNKKELPQYQFDDPALNQKLGVFVTLKKKGQLRGCMGNFFPETPLWQTVQKQAIVAATEDPRFPPVQPDELDEIEIEISVLSQPEKINDWRQIKLGHHGIIIRQGNRSGTFLPQVAEETGWSLEELLSQLCWQKAGLPPNCYQDPKTEIYVYTAEVFSEKEL